MTETDDSSLPNNAGRAAPPSDDDSVDRRTTSLPESQRASLLLVEDEAVLAMDLALMLQDMGYRVCATTDRSDDAVALAHAHQPDLVLMDIVIKGGVDGIETSRRIALEIGIPVIFLTAYSDAQTVSRAAETAPYGYITKPYRPRELRAAIEVALYKGRLERRLRESEKWFSEMLRCVADGVVATDADAKVRFMNPAAEEMLDCRLESTLGTHVDRLFSLTSLRSGHPVESPIVGALRPDGTASITFANVFVLPGGKRIPVDTSAAPIRDERQRTVGAVLAFRDISERVGTEEALRRSEERFRSAFDLAPAGMALVSLDGRFLESNDAMLKLLQRQRKELDSLTRQAVTHPEDLDGEEHQLRQLLSNQQRSVQFEKRYRRSEGDHVWTLVSVSLLSGHLQPLCYLYQVHDLSRHKEYEHQLMRLALFDSLTGLHNRAHMRDQLDRLLASAGRGSTSIAVVFIDLDHFKEINDTLGHDIGDQVLQVVAQRIRKAVRRSDAVGRLGGDEFLVVLPEVGSAADIGAILSKLYTEFDQPMYLRGEIVRVGLSIGVAMFPADGRDSVSLLRCADSALYHAKEQGRNNWQFYEPEMTQRVRHRLHIETDLREAVDGGQLRLHYQPLVALGGRGVVGFEALLRWEHPERGLLLPGEFIEIAEGSGLIHAIGRWSLHNACATAASWPPGADDAPPLEVAVNVSVRQFAGEDLVRDVRIALEDSGLAPGRLCIEITERLWLRDTEQNMRILDQLKALGVKIAIDDFGIGYSSFGYIERLQPDKIKIDGSLVHNCATDARKGAIVRALIAMAANLGASTVAEHVESEAQDAFLRGEQCTFGQGFLYGAAMPAENVGETIRRLAGPPG